MITKLSWHWPFWIYTIETGLCLIGIILFLDETYYDRRLPEEKQPPQRSRMLRLVGIEQYQSRHLRNTFLESMMRPVKVILKPTVFISTIYFLFTFAWVVGINTTLSIFIGPLYHFGPKQIGTCSISNTALPNTDFNSPSLKVFSTSHLSLQLHSEKSSDTGSTTS